MSFTFRSFLTALYFLFLSFSLLTSNAFAEVGLSANFLGLFLRGTGVSDDRNQVPHNGPSLQEAELQLNSDVDPYFRANVLLSISQESGSTGFGIDPEEIYLETISLPVLTVKGGQFKIALGRQNQLHTHAYPFIDAPLINQVLLGDEGLNEVGLSVAALLPASWFSEVIAQGFSLSNSELLNSPSSGSLGGLLGVRNLWDLNDDLTLEFGVYGTVGKNQFDEDSSAFDVDLIFKWRPAVGGKYQALIWQTEYLDGNRPGLTDGAGNSLQSLGGLATWLQFQFAERWWIQGRTEFLGLPHSVGLTSQNKKSLLIGFFPSEFSGFRLQLDQLVTTGEERADYTGAIQYNISIGAHPAHAY